MIRKKPVLNGKCGVCEEVPVYRITADCGHVFCYYCVEAQGMPRCPVCSQDMDLQTLKHPINKKS